MSRDVRHDGMGAFRVRFPFDRILVDRIKTLPDRRWNAAERFWWVPEEHVVLLVDLLHPERFCFDEATCELYRGSGGTAALDPDGPAPPPAQPGLFDVESPADSRGTAQDYTVSTLNEQVRGVLEAAFPRSVWLVGEISGFNRNAHKRHVGFQLLEREGEGRTVSSVDTTLFEQERSDLERALAQAGDPFRLEDEVAVRMRVRVELYVPWGSYRVCVEELDVRYTLGEAARRREEILRRLTEQGLVGLNTGLDMPVLPLRVGLVTSLGSDAYRDVVRTLEESGYAFCITAHGARVQGRSTEPSVLNALDWFRLRAGEFDVVLICRGGGSRTDLAWFDSEILGRAVATFPLPVVVGIGHEQDHSVLDAVGRRAKTPTAAAAFLVETVRRGLERVEALGSAVLDRSRLQVEEEAQRGAERARRLALATRGLLERERVELGHRRDRTVRAARNVLEAAGETLGRWIRDIPRASWIQITHRRELLEGARRAIVQGARRDVAAVGRHVRDLARVLEPRAVRIVARERERLDLRGRRLDLVDPRRVVERGYAILRLADGHVLTRAGMAPPGTALTAELKHGALRLRSVGGEPGTGGD